jgi:hypothetical protein
LLLANGFIFLNTPQCEEDDIAYILLDSKNEAARKIVVWLFIEETNATGKELKLRGKPPTTLFEIHKKRRKIKPFYTESYRPNIKAVKIDQSRVF